VKEMGLATVENKEQLKELMEQRKKKVNLLKRLQQRQRASTRYREKRKRIVMTFILN
jgi:hypothetical protein